MAERATSRAPGGKTVGANPQVELVRSASGPARPRMTALRASELTEQDLELLASQEIPQQAAEFDDQERIVDQG